MIEWWEIFVQNKEQIQRFLAAYFAWLFDWLDQVVGSYFIFFIFFFQEAILLVEFCDLFREVFVFLLLKLCIQSILKPYF